MENEQEQQQGKQPTPKQQDMEIMDIGEPELTEVDPAVIGQFKRKYYLTAEQQRIVDTLGEYEKAYVSVSSKQGNFLVLNGDITEHVRSNTLTALVKKGYLKENGRNRLKLI